MQIHLLDISSCDGKTIQESVIPELEKIDFQMGSFPVLAKEPVELTITNTGDKVLEKVLPSSQYIHVQKDCL